MTVRNEPVAPVGRRPKDRKTQIARAAAEAFSELGYHAVSMDAIAAKVGVSPAALYRHYSGKYDLFRDAVLALGQQLVDGTDFVDAQPHDVEPAATLQQLVHALIDLTLLNRKAGGLYRWQARHLHGDDRSIVKDQLRLVHDRIQQPLTMLRPGLISSQRWMLSCALLSVIGSIVDHRVPLTPDEIRALLIDASSAVLATDLPHPDDTFACPPAWRIFDPDAGTYEALLHASMMLFHRHGYAETSMAQIASSVGIPVSGIYRYFSGKNEILSAGLVRAADRVSGHYAVVTDDLPEPQQMWAMAREAFVATSFANPELAAIHYTERVNLPRTDQDLLRGVHRSTIDSWVRLLTSERPGLTATQARFLMHAAMALVVDVGRLVHFDISGRGPAGDSSYLQACVRQLMHASLFGCE
ncbi:TetR/AcrR family transcriptional regulator [[Mycobacterium] nativiensis]|uniref:TetR/AcrR family transcriptional regulator n=1 Tax=[Mycobacterium] nativiensis TaxID=2855503 RepID=A0ABU5Y1N6_9MYCO|nr:TetR/AcrR family transcriptional regulator [Mycolicibacter sp. MYC340]MEB3034154.1 TetR/AcrR family transcriptional regulator [Mycolicibacter sp. MYC340]